MLFASFFLLGIASVTCSRYGVDQHGEEAASLQMAFSAVVASILLILPPHHAYYYKDSETIFDYVQPGCVAIKPRSILKNGRQEYTTMHRPSTSSSFEPVWVQVGIATWMIWFSLRK